MIKITAKGLAKFMTAGESRKRSILRNFKFPDPEGYAQAARTGHGLHFIIRTWVTVSVAGRRVFCRRATSSSAVLRL